MIGTYFSQKSFTGSIPEHTYKVPNLVMEQKNPSNQFFIEGFLSPTYVIQCLFIV